MNKRLISIFLAVGMVFCLIPASFAADTDSMVTVISNDDFTANPDVCFGYWENPNEQYSKGQIWGAYYDANTWVTRTAGKGWEFIQSKNMTKGQSIYLKKLAFTDKSVLSKSDLKFTVGFCTGAKTDIEYGMRFGASPVTPFEYNSKTGKLTLGAPGVSNREVQLEENTEYRIETTYAYNKSAGVYGVNHKIFKADDEGNYTLETERDFPDDSDHLSDVQEMVAKNEIYLNLNAYGAYDADTPLTYFTLYDIKIENIVWGDIVDIGGLKYSDTGISFEDTGAEVALNTGKYNPSDALNYVTSNDAEWLANNCWGCDDTYYSTNQMKSEDGYLWIKTRTGGEYYPQYGTLSHHFTPVKDGSTLYFTSDIKFPKLVDLVDDYKNNKTYGGMLSLSSLDGANKLNIFEYSFKIYTGVRFMLGGKNQGFDINGSNESQYAKTLDWQQWDQPTLSAPDFLSLSVTLSPSMDDSSKYEADIIIENPSGELPETVIETDEPILLDKDFAESLCKLELSSTREGLYANGNTNRIAGLKNIKFETSNRAKENEGLKAGETSLYIPFNNITKNNFGAALCAAVTDKTTGLQKAFYTAEYDSILPYRGNLKIDLSVSDPAKEYVRVFIFDSFEKLSPLSVSKSTNN